jgi:2-amino-4-hydroxy-6-hydroxymethyldihydropteridine diphosphokinase
MATAYIALGSNQGDKGFYLTQAAGLLARTPGLTLQRASSRYETEPWGVAGQDDYWNQVLSFKCSLAPKALLNSCQAAEERLGRRREKRWGPRVIDIDILLLGAWVCREERLTIPHPYMKKRLFVLIPLMEIAPGLVFPDDGRPIGEVVALARTTQDSRIKRL